MVNKSSSQTRIIDVVGPMLIYAAGGIIFLLFVWKMGKLPAPVATTVAAGVHMTRGFFQDLGHYLNQPKDKSEPLWTAFLPPLTLAIGATIGFIQWQKNFNQKQEHFQREQLENSVKAMQDRFSNPITRPFAVQQLAEMAVRPISTKRQTFTEENFPFFSSIVKQFTMALALEDNYAVRVAITRGIEDMVACATDHEAWYDIGTTIGQLADANRIAKKQLLSALGKYAASPHVNMDDETTREKLVVAAPLCSLWRELHLNSQASNAGTIEVDWRKGNVKPVSLVVLEKLLASDEFSREATKAREQRRIEETPVPYGDVGIGELGAVVQACERLLATRDLICTCLTTTSLFPSKRDYEDFPQYQAYKYDGIIDFTGCILTGMDLANRDVSKIRWDGSIIANSDLSQTKFSSDNSLTNIMITGCSFAYSKINTNGLSRDFRYALLWSTEFRDNNGICQQSLWDLDFSGAKVFSLSDKHHGFDACIFTDADVSHLDFRPLQLQRCVFDGKKLKYDSFYLTKEQIDNNVFAAEAKAKLLGEILSA